MFDEPRRMVFNLGNLPLCTLRQAQAAKVRGLQEQTARELDAMMPSILDRNFKQRWKHGYA